MVVAGLRSRGEDRRSGAGLVPSSLVTILAGAMTDWLRARSLGAGDDRGVCRIGVRSGGDPHGGIAAQVGGQSLRTGATPA